MGSSGQPGNPERGRRDNESVGNEWSPSGVLSTMWFTLGILLGLFAFFLFGLIYSLIGSRSELEDRGIDWLTTGVLTGSVLIAHQLIHGLISRMYGGRPTLDVDVIHWVLPVFSFRIDGQQFSRSRYLLYSLGPLFLPSALGIVLMPVFSQTSMLILPLSVNAGFSIRDVWTAGLVWLQPRGSLVEVRNGLLVFSTQ